MLRTRAYEKVGTGRLPDPGPSARRLRLIADHGSVSRDQPPCDPSSDASTRSDLKGFETCEITITIDQKDVGPHEGPRDRVPQTTLLLGHVEYLAHNGGLLEQHFDCWTSYPLLEVLS